MRAPLSRQQILYVDISGPVGSRRCRLLLDTASVYVMISQDAARDLGFDLTNPNSMVPIATTLGIVEAPLFTSREIRIADVVVPSVEVCVHDLPEEVRTYIDGLLGMSFLEHTNFTFDFKAKVFTMVDP